MAAGVAKDKKPRRARLEAQVERVAKPILVKFGTEDRDA